METLITYKRLSATEREDISRALAQGQTFGQIAMNLGRQTSTISRELSRLRYSPRSYRATFAQEMAVRKRNHRTKAPPKLLAHEQLRNYVIEHLKLHWSPEQIAARLKLQYPNDMAMRAVVYKSSV